MTSQTLAAARGPIDHTNRTGALPVPEAAAREAARLKATGEAHVWWWPFEDHVDQADFDLLDEVEQVRARRYRHERDAAAFTRTRAGARRAIGELLGVDARTVALGRRVCPGCGDLEHGPPAVASPAVGLALSLTRTGGCGVLALHAGDWIGVDIEALRPVESGSLASVVLAPAEHAYILSLPAGPERTAAFHRVWTRKEAVLKGVGLGLLGIDLNALDVRPAVPGPLVVDHGYRGEVSSWQVDDLDLNGNWSASLARPIDGSPLGPILRHGPS
ncbi:4'-phosphopantetheinyl transferase superfamily protein [Streptomyces sp. NPDC048606]|uniref:4'-phosphopantetheinyl transferase family protein n=1 Tax=Streptomyces sp. NPDC048606 TaxID=3154726 RepID=UPI00342305AB